MVEYGVAVTNKFHFLSDEEGADPDDILSKASQIKKEKGPIVKKPTPPVVKTEVVKPERTHANKENEGTRGRGSNRGRGGNRESGERRERRENNDRPPRERRENGDRPPREGGERRGRGRGFGGAERRPRPQNQEGDAPVVEGHEERVEGERPFRGRGRGGFRRGGTRGDRVSGSDATGVRPREKRHGYGKGNWGTEQDELKGETEALNEVEGDKSTENVNPEAPVEPEQEKEEEKPSGITLAEWKKRQEQKDAEKFNVRKPNIDKKLNLIPVKRNEEEEEDKHEEEYVYQQRESRHKVVDIPVNFSTGNTRSFGNRGDRRGGRGRGGDRQGRGRNQGFNLSQEAFPAL